ncbi:uncharacterized protein Eint_111085 [Encephalitozoon intestinalis ATCC 50506]|uniref:Uncharacterized protein n=1 Tax=Encephalitozoon intestinalis (strain ATCC 50506) TaxID=876142 RepID=W8P9F1_ENCIT|nr:uncharacterized protein Eint_111085 [Encephalitozoon intestinalis ATCC 50506]AHL30172.1 hypothetical protein Eint_111085 [Encephalitozoon intestinalis ATCC 50506]UTX46467.1 hypothetical protein GPK93_11g20770 [Encephalitozoon intestinalis]
MSLKEKFDVLRNSIAECDQALRKLEQRSKILTQHVETSILMAKSRETKKQGTGETPS